MHISTLLTTAALAGLALANPAPEPVAIPQITPGPFHPHAIPRAGLSPRAISITVDKNQLSCARAFTDIAEDMPTATRPLQSWAASALPQNMLTANGQLNSQLTTICSQITTVTPPASLSSEYSSYLVAASSWLSKSAAEIKSKAAECKGLMGALMEVLIISDEPSCTTAVLDLVNAYNGVDPTGAAAGGKASPNNAAGPRETGMVAAAAAAVVGAVGVVAAL
ncbi:hypothetical protein VTI74DRAFT_8206 [Chaetomium olivicolor]